MLCNKFVAVADSISLWTARINADAFAGLAAFVPSTLRTSPGGIFLHEFGAVVIVVTQGTLRINFHTLTAFATFFSISASYTVFETSC